MTFSRQIEDPRRRTLVRALSLGFLAAGGAFAQTSLGQRPGRLPPERSIYRVTGNVAVNGATATEQTKVRPGDTVRTGKGAEVIFVVGTQALLVRGDSELKLEAADEPSLVVRGLRLLRGALLQVSRDTPMRVITSTATVGIRGTGFYVAANPEQTYFCTCYGTTEVSATDDPTSRQTVVARAHDRPLYILGSGDKGRRLRDAPFIDHTDQELALIEALVGREPPFVFPKDSYSAPRKGY